MTTYIGYVATAGKNVLQMFEGSTTWKLYTFRLVNTLKWYLTIENSAVLLNKFKQYAITMTTNPCLIS